MNSTELLSCPFCGGGASLALCGFGTARVVCMDCGSEGQYCASHDDAIAAWNRRASINSVVCEAGVNGKEHEPCREQTASKALRAAQDLFRRNAPATSMNCLSCNGYGRVNDGSGARSPYGPKCPKCGGSGRVLAASPPPPGSARDSAEADLRAPATLPESMSRDEMLRYYSEYANMVAQEVLSYQRQIRELKAALAAAGMSAEGGEAKSETTPEEDAALLWLGTVRDDFRRMADEANRLLSHHAMNIAASPKAGESRTELEGVEEADRG